MTLPLRIAWLTTGRGPGSFGALEYVLAAIDGGLPVELGVVFVNREPGEAAATDALMTFAESRGVPVEAVSSVRFRKERGGARSKPGEQLPAWRAEYDEEAAQRLGKYDFQLGMMFGYMLIATPALHERFTFLNDHPALPDGPIGTYQEVILELMRAGATESGCMMNLVTGDLDRGPAVSFCRFPTRDAANESLWQAAGTEPGEQSDLYADLRARGIARERPFVVETLRAIAEGRLEVPPEVPLDLTDVVEG
ncbi:MAG: formyltransferase family protein [Dehalococcoidia bacterium]